jgi:hypothetical protein
MESKIIRTLGLILLSLLLAPSTPGLAQEINCAVTVSFDQSRTVDESIVQQLRTYVSDLLNKRSWTNDQFSQEEKIKCQLNINVVQSPAPGSYQAQAMFSVHRPIYNSTYESPIFTYVDRAFNFQFLPNTPYFFNENSYTDELSYAVAFLAYIALAVDYDSFGKLGGSPYIQKAFNIANLARNASPYARVWSPESDSRSRYWLIENLNSQQFVPYREGLYKYHRNGLDRITESPSRARAEIMETLNAFRQVALLRPGSILLNSFFDAKIDELYNVLREANADDRQKAFTWLSSMDPSKTENYRRLVNGAL